MFKKIIILLSLVLFLVGCEENADVKYERAQLIQENNDLKEKIWENRAILEGTIKEKVDRDIATYLVTFQIKQSTFTINIGEHIKNGVNAIKLTLPVSKDFYNACTVGEEINSAFKWGSLIFNGDFSSLKVKVLEKEIR